MLDDDRARGRSQSLIIVGDAFAKPMLRALDADPDRWDLSSLFMVTSSGVMWSEPVKQGLLRHNPNMLLIDVFSSSEALGLGASVSSGAARPPARPSSRLGETARVIGDDGARRRAGLGPDRPGGGQGPHPDRLLQGPGEVGGHLRRPSTASATRSPATTPRSRPTAPSPCSAAARSCINTGGEKVFPEEVEEILKEHPTVLRRGRGRRARRQVRRGHHRRGRGPARRRRSIEAELIAQVKSRLAVVQGAQARAWPSTPSAGPPTARSTTSA